MGGRHEKQQLYLAANQQREHGHRTVVTKQKQDGDQTQEGSDPEHATPSDPSHLSESLDRNGPHDPEPAGLRITHVLARFKTYSGAEHFCFHLTREATRRGHRVTIVTRHLPRSLRRHVPEGVEVRQLAWAHAPTRFHFFESICDVLYSPFLRQHLPGDSTCDLYWNDNTLASLFIDSVSRDRLRAFFCLQLPHFAYGQTMLVARSYPPLSWLVPVLAPIYRALDRLFARRADLIMAISRMVKRDCERVYGRRDVALVSPGIDPPPPELVDPGYLRERLGVESEHIILSAGKIIPKKNFDLFVQAVGVLRDRGLDVSGVIIGDGPFRGRIESLVQRMDLRQHCILTGFLPDHADVLRYMSGADVYVYLEPNVPFGLTPLEAGSLGVPVVAFEGGGVEETIRDGENGRKIASSCGPEEIADIVQELLLLSTEERRQMGNRGRQLAARWTWERSYDQLLRALHQRAER